MINWIKNKLTKNRNKIPLFWATIDIDKYNKAKVGSSIISIHPIYKEDEFIKDKLEEVVDYIRNNYDVNEL